MTNELKEILENPENFVFEIDYAYRGNWVSFRKKHEIINKKYDEIIEDEPYHALPCNELVEHLLSNLKIKQIGIGSE